MKFLASVANHGTPLKIQRNVADGVTDKSGSLKAQGFVVSLLDRTQNLSVLKYGETSSKLRANAELAAYVPAKTNKKSAHKIIEDKRQIAQTLYRHVFKILFLCEKFYSCAYARENSIYIYDSCTYICND